MVPTTTEDSNCVVCIVEDIESVASVPLGSVSILCNLRPEFGILIADR